MTKSQNIKERLFHKKIKGVFSTRKYLSVFVDAIIAGICIAIGGIAFLSIENSVVGALFFTLGLFTIVTRQYNLFTGKVCYVFDNKPSYLLDVVIIWIGNLAGTYLTGALVKATRIVKICERAETMCQTKLNDNLLSLFVLAIFCNMLIFIAVDGFKNNEHHVGKYLSLFFGVAGFIVCGFEHCVADMFYFTVGSAWSGKTFGCLMIITLGNIVGGLLLPLAKKVRVNK